METQRRQYGLWESSLSTEMLAGETGLGDVQWADGGDALVWQEQRGDRGVLVVRRGDEAPRVVNDRLSVRGGVGYGGGAFTVREETIFFCADDGRLYRVGLDRGLPTPVTPEWGSVASPVVSPNGQWVVYVHHHDDVDRLAIVDADGDQWPSIVAEGGDFYMQPAWHPDGDRLVWIRWDHPNMPWNETSVEAVSLRFDGGRPVADDTQVLSASEEVAHQQPTFSPDGSKLAYLTDGSGHWQLVVRDIDSGEETVVSEAGREYAGPAWIQGLRFYQWSPDGESIVALAAKKGMSSLERRGLDGSAKSAPESNEYTRLAQLSVAPSGEIAAIGSSSSIPSRVVRMGDDGSHVEAFSSSERLSEDELSTVRPVSWPVDDEGPIETVHGLYYPPTNPAFEGVGKPPALVMIHGGPTSQRVATWEPSHQFFATRGWSVLDVNYRGSTGYGRKYIEALFGRWGEVDVADAVGAAAFLVEEGLADADRLVIMGGSAGGYTVLQTLVRHPGVFAAGVANYGVSNLFELQRGTHKFEERYCDSLVGTLPEDADLYRERSPLFSADQIEDAVALYHGAEDKVVPVEQSAEIAASLKRRGVPHLHHVYDDEGHGWRKPETVEHFHRSVLEFLVEHVVYG